MLEFIIYLDANELTCSTLLEIKVMLLPVAERIQLKGNQQSKGKGKGIAIKQGFFYLKY